MKLLEVKRVSKIFRQHHQELLAVNNVSFSLEPRQILALIGENGSGKTTLAKIVAGLIQPSSGHVIFSKKVVVRPNQQVQLLFQNPLASLNPKWSVASILAEAIYLAGYSHDSNKRVDELLELVKLPRSIKNQYPHQLSSGERQRVGLARALSLEPRVLILDEPFASLDNQTANSILGLLRQLQKRLGISCLLICHDFSLVKSLAETALVICQGVVVEKAPLTNLKTRPLHPYTQSLIGRQDDALSSPPSLISWFQIAMTESQNGCIFLNRCPKATEICLSQPPLKEISSLRSVACHHVNK